MIHLLYSADYELFLGGIDRTEEEVLIRPTERLLATCDKAGIPLTLFADVACLWRYRELGRDAFPALAEAQLRDAASRGHDVQTHLHPHWGFTRIEGGRFLFDPATYLTGTLDPDPAVRYRLTREALQRASAYLTDLIRPVRPDYRCLAFRAGGYGLQPEPGMLLRALAESGYRIDSSIIPGAILSTPVQRVDFSRVPAGANYWLEEKTGLDTAAPEGCGLFEIPIAACHLDGLDRLRVRGPEALRQTWNTLLGREGSPPARGRPCTLPVVAGITAKNRLQRAWWGLHARMNNRFLRLELGTSHRALSLCLDRHLQRCRYRPSGGKPLFLALNCHPKGLFEPHFDTLERFHATLLARHDGAIRAVTFQQAWERIRSGLREGERSQLTGRNDAPAPPAACG